ncbi:unnamed protein product [Urochloa humidicola]
MVTTFASQGSTGAWQYKSRFMENVEGRIFGELEDCGSGIMETNCSDMVVMLHASTTVSTLMQLLDHKAIK